jgi:ABC-2 type transport system ATP-binding protein
MSVLEARGVGVRRRRGWLFQGLDVTVEPGDVVAVIGPPGSGRTTALLALAGRFRLGAGSLAFSRTPSLGHVPEAEAPEPVFTVAEHVRERLALLGRATKDVELHGLDPQKQGRDLTPYQKQVLGLILAALGEPPVIALDGLDDGLDAGEQQKLWELIQQLADRGIAVLVTAREVDPDRVTEVIDLGVLR